MSSSPGMGRPELCWSERAWPRRAWAVDYRRIDYADRPTVLLMGNEQAGLPDELADACEVLALIPQAGRADSLNLAVATGIMLFEARRSFLELSS